MLAQQESGGRKPPLSVIRQRCNADRFGAPERLTPEEARLLIEAPWRCDAFDGVLDALAREPPPDPMPSHPFPVRLVWGTHDKLLPVRGYSELWRKVLPQAEWVELHGAGHVPMYDDPHAVVRAILDVTTRGKGE
jgi:pimeloyl-ACP methyl ester carboxylesterase